MLWIANGGKPKNIDSEGRQAIAEVIRTVFSEHLMKFDPRKYLAPTRKGLIKTVKYKNERVLGSADKA